MIPFNRIGIVTRPDTPAIAPDVRELVQFLHGRGAQVLMEAECACQLLDEPSRSHCQLYDDGEDWGRLCNLIVVLGGDGTFLSAARKVAPYRVPVVGVNLGTLGFLAQVPREQMLEELARILSGQYLTENCILLQADVRRNGEEIYRNLALNDVVLSRGSAGKMIEFEVFINEQFVYTQRSDGLIVSTPTGSTAYALAAGGAILQAGLNAFTLVPVCPQSLTNRPIVISDTAQIDILVTKADDARVHYDGQSFTDIRSMDSISLRRYHHAVKVINPVNYQYYRTLRQKLHWGEQLV
ncbi:NAD(+)/NADH kinase [Conchiformibius steedae DSM 2580]|uniref:NAD kinase n=1 Tax=Conchiformibius steedae DSM 2580 TaxID=1121352 RepID=A0AAE9KZY4_9NEIS|nr:NAD(+)/NADH kinase [Conchiformibius steedae]QMT32736.1 NAD(+)/NADH kinase [Conchiformibius steedae]URD67345.1 NAD(+)/NADH kinase [Conchiformibius steedae DSM 2580]